MAEGDINIYGAVRSMTGEGKAAYAAQVYDEALGKFQSEINQSDGTATYYSDIQTSDITEGEITGTTKTKLQTLRTQAQEQNAKLVMLKGGATYVVAIVETYGSTFNMWFIEKNRLCEVTSNSDNTTWSAHWTDMYVKPSTGIPSTDLEEEVQEKLDGAVQTGSYDATVGVGLADNLRGDTVIDAEFYKRKTGGTQSVGSGIAAIKEVRGKSFVWNQLFTSSFTSATNNGITATLSNGELTVSGTQTVNGKYIQIGTFNTISGHKYYCFSVRLSREKFYIQYFGGIEAHADLGTVIMQANSDAITTMAIRGGNSGDVINWKGYPKIFDLTLMFGAGKEPATVAEFEKMFPLDYYDYNAGEVIPFAGQNLTTIGKNQYNPATGKANLLGGQTYQISGTYTSAEIDGVAVTLDSNNCFTTTKDCVLDVTGGNDTDTFVGLYNGETNTYEPYEKHTLPLDPSQWRDKQGNLVFPYGGMHGVGTAYDYAKVDADGYIRKAVRCFGQVDLGSLNWTKFTNSGNNGYYYRSSTINDIKYYQFTTAKQTILSSYFTQDALFSIERGICGDKSIAANNMSHTNTKKVHAYDSSYSDASTFKTAMQGVPLIYELATPVEVELATPVYAKYLVDKDGTEEITPANGTTPYTTMANLSILYAMDARGEIKNLSKRYLSKESTENMLNAMVTAGVIASYTMTWDAANNRYAFTIVAPTPEEPNN